MSDYWRELGRKEGRIVQAKNTVLRYVLLGSGLEPSNEIRGIVESIQEESTLDGILDELWGVKDLEKIERIIKKYAN